MKKTISFVLALIMVLAAFAGCSKETAENGAPSSGNTADVSSFKTLGDIFNAVTEGQNQSSTYDTCYVYAFQIGDEYYRATANISEDVKAKLDSIDYSESDVMEKEQEILAPLAIDKLENLSENILSQEELDKLVGKKGEELFNDGWETGMGYNTETMEFWLDYNCFEYTVVFDGTVEEGDEFDETEALKPLTVKSVTLNGLGNATDIEMPEE